MASMGAQAVTAEIVSAEAFLLGGRVSVHLQPRGSRPRAEEDARAILGRLGAWAVRLTRFSPTSDLSRLNADPGDSVTVRPTLAAVLDWARAAESATDSIVNAAMLDLRIAAESSWDAGAYGPERRRPVSGGDAWSMDRGPRTTRILRPAGLRFDLDGVAKGWLADRALALLAGYPAAVVNADGDLALHLAPGESWWIGIEDPAHPGMDVATLRLAAEGERGTTRFGVATSGTSIHRWDRDGRPAHHLIDPRTGMPAETDIVQATVIAGSARLAEAYAKTAVILGSAGALLALDRPGVEGAVLLTDRRDLLVLPKTMRYLP
jgi:thiamine biosynthesis lipoprotein